MRVCAICDASHRTTTAVVVVVVAIAFSKGSYYALGECHSERRRYIINLTFVFPMIKWHEAVLSRSYLTQRAHTSTMLHAPHEKFVHTHSLLIATYLNKVDSVLGTT